MKVRRRRKGPLVHTMGTITTFPISIVQLLEIGISSILSRN